VVFLLPDNGPRYADSSMAQRVHGAPQSTRRTPQATIAARHEPASPVQIGDTQ
jgi:hypothetical protein